MIRTKKDDWNCEHHFLSYLLNIREFSLSMETNSKDTEFMQCPVNCIKWTS